MTCKNRYKTIELGMDLEKNNWEYYYPSFEFVNFLLFIHSSLYTEN